MEKEDLEAIAQVLRGTNIMVLSDEIYAELTYGLQPHVSIASLPGMAERTVVVNGFSKTYAMTGLAAGLRLRPCADPAGDDQDPPECDHERPYHQPVCSHHRTAGLRSGDRPDAGRVQYAPPPGGAQL